MAKGPQDITPEELEEARVAAYEVWEAIGDHATKVIKAYSEQWKMIYKALQDAGFVESEPPMPDPVREAAERRVEGWINGERECL